MTEAGYECQQTAARHGGLGLRRADAALTDERVYPAGLKSCFFNVDIKVVEWNTLFTNWRLGARDLGEGIDAINVSAAVNDPYFGLILLDGKAFASGDQLGLLFHAGDRAGRRRQAPLPRRR